MSHTRWAVPIILLAVAAVLAGWAIPRSQSDVAAAAPSPVYENADMRQAAAAFLASLEPEQRTKALFEFEDAERLNWHFVPRARRGLSLREMSPEQRKLARGILRGSQPSRLPDGEHDHRARARPA